MPGECRLMRRTVQTVQNLGLTLHAAVDHVHPFGQLGQLSQFGLRKQPLVRRSCRPGRDRFRSCRRRLKQSRDTHPIGHCSYRILHSPGVQELTARRFQHPAASEIQPKLNVEKPQHFETNNETIYCMDVRMRLFFHLSCLFGVQTLPSRFAPS